jgi:hypothetical protein
MPVVGMSERTGTEGRAMSKVRESGMPEESSWEAFFNPG